METTCAPPAMDAETGNAVTISSCEPPKNVCLLGATSSLRKQRTSHNRHHVVRLPPPQILVVTPENQPLGHWNPQESVHLVVSRTRICCGAELIPSRSEHRGNVPSNHHGKNPISSNDTLCSVQPSEQHADLSRTVKARSKDSRTASDTPSGLILVLGGPGFEGFQSALGATHTKNPLSLSTLQSSFDAPPLVVSFVDES